MKNEPQNTAWIGREKNFTTELNKFEESVVFVGNKLPTGEYEIEGRNIIPFLNREDELVSVFIRPGLYAHFDKSGKQSYRLDVAVLKRKGIFFGCLAILIITLAFPYGSAIWYILPVYIAIVVSVIAVRWLRFVFLVMKST